MIPLVGFTGACAAAAGLAGLLPAPWSGRAWLGLAAAYLGTTAWGTVSIRACLLGTALTRVPAASGMVALTFDDGPDPEATPRLLDVLREHGARATFFVIGARARAWPALVRRCHEEGHLLGNHSDRHSSLLNLRGKARLRAELQACQAAIEDACGARARHYRPPFGLRNHALDGVCRELGLGVVGWRVRGLDTGARTAASVAARVLAAVTAGDIVLLHDRVRDPARPAAIASRLLEGLAARGLRAGRLDEMGAS